VSLNLGNIIDQLEATPAFIQDKQNKNAAKTLRNKLGALQNKIDGGEYQDAINKLTNDFLGKTDGCGSQGAPDNNDWVDTCGDGTIDFTNADGQEEFEALINLTIAYLQTLLP
jgi:hypothetical protein